MGSLKQRSTRAWPPGSRADREVCVIETARSPVLNREDVELLRLIASGLPIDSIARRLDTSARTVRRRVKSICDRLGCATSIQAVVWAARHGLV
jgi:DNA-binding NarL/FixJ family response regulator